MSSDLINKWQHVLDRLTIPTWTETVTLAYLADLASKSIRIIESGTYLGASAKVMLLANPKLRLYCIDTFECSGEPMMLDYLNSLCVRSITPKDLSTFEICRWFSLKREIEEGRCTLIIGNSETASKQLAPALPVLQADAIWVDDGHAEEDVQRDIRCLMPFLKSGGQMVGHDFDVPHNDVARGVIASGISYDVPIPRLWRHIKP